MNLEFVANELIPTGLGLLPPRYDTLEARAMLLAIGLQESGFAHRKQIRGPARSFWQFEKAGISGVLMHSASRRRARSICAELDYRPIVSDVYEAIAHNDRLGVVFARLLLYTIPRPLPVKHDHDAWRQYISAWRPGKPRFEDWARNYRTAWGLVEKTL